MEKLVVSGNFINNNNKQETTATDSKGYEYDEASENSIVDTSSGTPTRSIIQSKKRNATPKQQQHQQHQQRSTPVKKIIKRLFVCNSSTKKKGKVPPAAALPPAASSLEGGFRGFPLEGIHRSKSLKSSTPARQKYLTTTSEAGTTASETAATQSTRSIPTVLSNLTEDDSLCYLQSPPRKGKLSTMKDPTAIPLPDSPVGDRKSPHLMNEILPLSPDNIDEEFFLPEESSSSGSDGPSPVTTPNHLTMRSPGMDIPTPQTRPRPLFEDEDKNLLFSHPLRTISESPKVEGKNHNPDQSVDIDEDAFLPNDFNKVIRTYTWDEVQRYVQEAETHLKEHLEDRHQHLMEEFQEEAEKALQEHGTQWKADAEVEFRRMENLLKEERAKTQQKHMELINKVTAMAELQEQLKSQKLEREEYESYISSLEAQLREKSNNGQNEANGQQRQELDKEFQELQQQMKSLREQEQGESLQSTINEYEQEIQELRRKNAAAEKKTDDLQKQVIMLKRNQMKLQSNHLDVQEIEERHQEELRHLQASKEEANQQVLALQEQLDLHRRQANSSTTEDVIMLKAEKAAAERRLSEMQELINTRTEEKLVAQSSLRDSQAEVVALHKELEVLRMESSNNLDISGMSDISHEELFAARAEVETLRLLRQDDEKEKQTQMQAIIAERDALKSQLKKMKQKYQNELNSPRRRGKESTLSIHTMTVEVEPSPRNNSEQENGTKAGERLKILGQNFAKLQEEKIGLEFELQQLKASYTEAVEKATKEAESKVRSIQEEMALKEKEHEVEKRKIRADLSVAEITELTAEVEALKSRHQNEVKELKHQVSVDLQKAIQIERENAAKSKMRFEEEMNIIRDEYEHKIALLESKIKELQEEHEEEIELIKSQSKEDAEQELNMLQGELKRLRIEFEGERIEIINTSSKEQDDLVSRIEHLREKNRIEVEAAREHARSKMEEEINSLRGLLETANEKAKLLDVSKEECDELRRQVDSLKDELIESKSRGAQQLQQQIEELNSKFQTEMEDAKNKAQEEIFALQNSLETANTDKNKLLARLQVLASKLDEADKVYKQEIELVKKASQDAMDKELEALEETIKGMEMGDSKLAREVERLQAENEAARREYDLRVQKVREDHGREIEELLAQLDLVEEEHKERYNEKEKLVHEKDAVISALGSQLAEAQTRLSALSDKQESMEKELAILTEQLMQSRIETAAKNEDINRLLAEHRQAMEDQSLIREQACEEAREEMIKLAEVQFEQRNAHYKKLKHEFDNAVSKIGALESELKAVKSEAAAAKKQWEAREIDLADELAQAKAATASSDLNAARKMKQYRMELEDSKALEAELRRKLEEAQATSQSIQSTFAGIVSEKERLMKENNDLQAVCEELMAEIEASAAR